MIKDLPNDIKLDAIEFRSNDDGQLSSVSCVLSNGLESPLFKLSSDDSCGRKTLSLKDMNIRGVHMECERDHVYDHKSITNQYVGKAAKSTEAGQKELDQAKLEWAKQFDLAN